MSSARGLTDVKRWLAPGEDIQDAAAVRSAVFVDEQGFSYEGEFDAIDKVAHHLVIYDEQGVPVATARLFADADTPGTYHAGRIAVDKSRRGFGMGRVVMSELQAKASGLSGNRIVLSAQCVAREFYERCGYSAFGEEYMDEHCPHIDMQKEVKIYSQLT